MRFPWQRDVLLPEPLPTERVEVAVDEPTRETRQSGGDFSDAVVRLIEQTAAGSTADARGTAATESAAGALSRAFAAAELRAAVGAAGGVSDVPGASGPRFDSERGQPPRHSRQPNGQGGTAALFKLAFRGRRRPRYVDGAGYSFWPQFFADLVVAVFQRDFCEMGVRPRHSLCRDCSQFLRQHHEQDVDRHPEDAGRRERWAVGESLSLAPGWRGWRRGHRPTGRPEERHQERDGRWADG